MIQKSIREGFGLVVAEAMWKGKPMIGGISERNHPRRDRFSGQHRRRDVLEAVRAARGPEHASHMGEFGRQHIRRNFLLPHSLKNRLLLYIVLDNPDRNMVGLG